MKYVREDPQSVHVIWEFLRTEHPDLHSVLNNEYLQIIRNHFKPVISNLQTTPSNANKMVDILMDYSEQYDKRLYSLNQSCIESERMLNGAKQVLEEARRVVYKWGNREPPEWSGAAGEKPEGVEEEEDIRAVSQELLDTVVLVSTEKEKELENQRQANVELKKKLGKLNRALKEKRMN